MSGDGASSALRQDAEKEGKRRCVETIHGGTTQPPGGQHRLWFTEYISSQQAWPTALVSNPALTTESVGWIQTKSHTRRQTAVKRKPPVRNTHQFHPRRKIMPGRALILTVSIYVSASIRAADLPPDPVVTLAQILATKGIITAADVASVTAASTSRRVSVLTSILQGKGLLNESEWAEVWSESAGAARSPRIPPTVTPARAPQTVVPQPQPTPATTTSIPVTTKEGVAVSMYGTVLLNAFFNTAPTNIQDIPLAAIKQGTDLTGGDKNFGMTARQTRIGLRLHATNVARATLSGEFEFDMVGGKTPLANGIHMDIFRLRLV